MSALLAVPAGENVLDITTWVMSCRVFGRQLEDEVMNILVEAAQARGVHTIQAAYTPTAKNDVVRDLYQRLGFTLAQRCADGSSRWVLEAPAYARRLTFISRKELAHV